MAMQTYKAIIKRGVLEWQEDIPYDLPVEQMVYVTILDKQFLKVSEQTIPNRRRILKDMFQKLSQRNPFADIDNVISWQQEQRKDRVLPR